MKPTGLGLTILVVAFGLITAALAFEQAQGSIAGRGLGPATEEPLLPRSRRASEAEAAIERTNLGRKMEVNLGDAFGGVWFDASSAQVHVGVTTPASHRLAEAVAARAGLSDTVTETYVSSTWSRLESAQERLNRSLEDLLARGEVSTSLAPSQNSVEVELGSDVPASSRARVRRVASATGVEISVSVASTSRIIATPEVLPRCKKFEPDIANCDKPIVAGVTIKSESGKTCTAGPAVIYQDLSTSVDATDTYLLTAGHCIKESTSSKWFAFSKNGDKLLIGNAGKALHGERGAGNVDRIDAGVIFINNPGEWVNKGSSIPVNPAIAPWDKANEVEPFAVTSQAALPMEGTMSCISGQTSGTSCGEVVAPSKSESFDTGTTVDKLVEVKGATTGPGDSGAPWFSKGNRGEVQGTHVGSSNKGNALFQPLKYAFEELAITIPGGEGRTSKLQLLKTPNEKRHGVWLHNHQPIEEADAITAVGTVQFMSGLGGVRCGESTTYLSVQPGSTGVAKDFEVDPATCQGLGALAGCSLTAEELTGEPVAHATETGKVAVTDVEIWTKFEGCPSLPNPLEIEFAFDELLLEDPDEEPRTINQLSLSGEGIAHVLGLEVAVTASGLLNLSEPNTYGV